MSQGLPALTLADAGAMKKSVSPAVLPGARRSVGEHGEGPGVGSGNFVGCLQDRLETWTGVRLFVLAKDALEVREALAIVRGDVVAVAIHDRDARAQGAPRQDDTGQAAVVGGPRADAESLSHAAAPRPVTRSFGRGYQVRFETHHQLQCSCAPTWAAFEELSAAPATCCAKDAFFLHLFWGVHVSHATSHPCGERRHRR